MAATRPQSGWSLGPATPKFHQVYRTIQGVHARRPDRVLRESEQLPDDDTGRTLIAAAAAEPARRTTPGAQSPATTAAIVVRCGDYVLTVCRAFLKMAQRLVIHKKPHILRR
ncbi:unnamed protein product [Ectocarpus sp. 8 AP-2014]